MRFIFISDSHGYHESIELPKGDVLIHSGDFSSLGHTKDTKRFINWFLKLKGFDTKIFIAGNHDLKFELIPKPDWLLQLINDENLSQSDCIYLEDSEVIIEDSEFSRPIKIYGSPWQPEFCNWAFNLPREGIALQNAWNKIPDNTDILITHGPPFGIRDSTIYKVGSFGCELLRKRVQKIKPLIHCFGHFHDAHGVALIDDVAYINAASCNEQYNPVHSPIIIDINEVDGKLITEYINE